MQRLANDCSHVTIAYAGKAVVLSEESETMPTFGYGIVFVSDMTRSIEFYRDLLGLPRRGRMIVGSLVFRPMHVPAPVVEDRLEQRGQ